MSDTAARQADRSLEPPPLNHMLRRMQPIQRSRPGDPEWADRACDQARVVELLAHLGDEEAAEIAGVCVDRGGGAGDPLGNLPGLFAGVRLLASELPPKQVGRNQCDGCARGLPVRDGAHVGLKPWDGQLCTAYHYPIHYTPALRWLLVVAAEAVARKCVPVWESWMHFHDCEGPRLAIGAAGYPECLSCHAAVDARSGVAVLDACRRWIAEPTRLREEAWGQAWLHGPGRIGAELPPWLPAPSPEWTAKASSVLAAVTVIGPDVARAVAARAIMGAVRGFKEVIE